MQLLDFIATDAILPDLQANSKEEAIRAMVASLRDRGRVPEADEEGVIDALMKREELGSTGIGNGVAVPHTKHPAVDKLVATVALVHDGLEFASLDGEPVHILFLLISPPESTPEHLRALETVSRHLKNNTFCKLLRQATAKDEVVELLREADDQQFS